MLQSETAAMQRDSFRKGMDGPVLFVPNDGASDGFQLSANLMFAARDQFDLQFVPQVAFANVTVIQDGKFAVWIGGTHDSRLGFFFSTNEMMLQAILFLLRPLFDDRPIDFLGRLGSELFAESACAFAGTGQWQYACDRRVQAADHT